MDGTKIDAKLDLQGILCPINFVKTKLQLEEMEPGQILGLILDDGEPIQSAPRSLKEEGHRVIKVENFENAFKLLVQKA